MSVLEKLVGIIAPHNCVGCSVEQNRLLCESCSESLPLVPSRCYRCKAVTEAYAVCADCRAHTPLRHVYVHTYYQDSAKTLVHKMKYERARQAAAEIARLLNATPPVYGVDSLLTYVPTATSRVRTRGYDHANLLARGLATPAARPARVLGRVGQAHQVGARRAERLRQLDGAFRVLRPEQVKGKRVVLVDDVLTTGATLETVARVLRQAGAAGVDAVVFAQA